DPPPGMFSVVSRLAPFFFDVFAPVAALKDGLNASAPQLVRCSGVDSDWVPLSVEVSAESVDSGEQLVGLNRKPCLLTATLIVFRRSGTPLTIVGRTLVAITLADFGSTLIVARVTTVPRLNGPATAGTAIERPNGAPW